MVISGAGTNLPAELYVSSGSTSFPDTGFPDPDLFDHSPILVIALSHRWHLSLK